MQMKTLLLDSSFIPIQIVSWQKAIILWVTGRGEPVDHYENFRIQSATQSFPLPRIMRLHGRYRGGFHVKFNRENVFLRDHYTCQYCYRKFPENHLTFDHVIPLCRGGGTNWTNIVTCCRSCNSEKGDSSPEQFHRKLKTPPKTPSWSPKIILKIKENDPPEWLQWVDSFSRPA